MKTTALAVIAAGAWICASAGYAATPLELAQQNNCLACHGVDQKIVGPSYKEVAAKYKGQKKAEAMLIQKIKKRRLGQLWHHADAAEPASGRCGFEDLG